MTVAGIGLGVGRTGLTTRQRTSARTARLLASRVPVDLATAVVGATGVLETDGASATRPDGGNAMNAMTRAAATATVRTSGASGTRMCHLTRCRTARHPRREGTGGLYQRIRIHGCSVQAVHISIW